MQTTDKSSRRLLVLALIFAAAALVLLLCRGEERAYTDAQWVCSEGYFYEG